MIESGSVFGRAEFRYPSGRIFQSGDFAELGRPLGEPHVAIHRAELHRILVSALPTDILHLGMKCIGVKQDADKVTVQWADGQTDQADCVIAADGLHSVVRQQIFPDSKLKYAGRTSWRGIAKTQDKAALSIISQTWGRGHRFGFVSVDPHHVYWFAVSNLAEGQTPPTNERKEFLIQRFQGWHHPIEHLIDVTPAETIVEAPIYDIEPLPSWHQGRITLLGDAAHAATPDMAQGACMAIEDAVVFARCLSQENDLVAALHHYETERKPRTTWISNRSRAVGRLAHTENPLLCTLRDLLMAVLPEKVTRRQLEKAIHFEV